MNKIINILFSLLLLLFSSNLLVAQVTVGSENLPDKYSILQVDYDPVKYPNGAGIQLPRVSQVDRDGILADKIAVDPTAARGLAIFNTTTLKVECWDGSSWIIVPNQVTSVAIQNGLSIIPNEGDPFTTQVGLGGNLTENTTIRLEGHELNFQKDPAGLFQITNNTNNPAFAVTQGKVGIGTSDPQAKLHIVKPDGSRNFGLRLADGTQGTNFVLMADDDQGNAHWSVLPAKVDTREKIVTRIIGTATNLTNEQRLSDTIRCAPGKWLIIGKFGSQNSTAASKKYATASIKEVSVVGTTVTPVDVVAIAGAIAEPGGYSYALPQVVYYGEFEEETIIALYGQAPGSSTSGSNPGLNSWGGQNFGFLSAIKLAELDE